MYMAMLSVLFTAATWYHSPTATGDVRAAVDGMQPFVAPPPKQNQNRSSYWRNSLHPSWLIPEPILSTIDISVLAPFTKTHALTEKGLSDSCRFVAFPALTKSFTPSSENASPARPRANPMPPCNTPSLPSVESVASPSPAQ